MEFQKRPTLLLTLMLLIFLVQSTAAQRRDREREKPRAMENLPEKVKEEKPTDFKSHLWFGGGVNIGYGGYNGYSSFNFGLSPMVGYKVIGPLSVGPRVAYDLTSIKLVGYGSWALNSFDVGAFVRCRVVSGLFFQGELSNQWFQNVINLTKINDQRTNQRIGAGWNFGQRGGTGSEITILYNFESARDINSNLNPVEYRFGFTWKF